jgi:hypothetical protein
MIIKSFKSVITSFLLPVFTCSSISSRSCGSNSDGGGSGNGGGSSSSSGRRRRRGKVRKMRIGGGTGVIHHVISYR